MAWSQLFIETCMPSSRAAQRRRPRRFWIHFMTSCNLHSPSLPHLLLLTSVRHPNLDRVLWILAYDLTFVLRTHWAHAYAFRPCNNLLCMFRFRPVLSPPHTRSALLKTLLSTDKHRMTLLRSVSSKVDSLSDNGVNKVPRLSIRLRNILIRD